MIGQIGNLGSPFGEKRILHVFGIGDRKQFLYLQ